MLLYLEKRYFTNVIKLRFSKTTSRLASQFSLSVVSDSATPWTAVCQSSLSITNFQSLLKLMCIKLVMPSNNRILCRPFLLSSVFPSTRVFSKNQFLSSGGQRTGVSASASVLPINIPIIFRTDYL